MTIYKYGAGANSAAINSIVDGNRIVVGNFALQHYQIENGVTNAEIIGLLGRKAGNLYEEGDKISDFPGIIFELRQESGTKRSNTITSIDDLVDFINTEAVDTEDAFLAAFFELAPDRKFTKIYAVNSVFSMLRIPGRGLGRQRIIEPDQVNYGNLEDTVNEIIDFIGGDTTKPLVTKSAVCWFTQNSKTMYQLRKSQQGEIITVISTAATERHAFDTASGDYTGTVNTGPWQSVTDAAYLVYDESSGKIIVKETLTSEEKKIASFCRLYKIGNGTQVAAVIKPAGQDLFRTNYIHGLETARFYVVSYGTNSGKIRRANSAEELEPSLSQNVGLVFTKKNIVEAGAHRGGYSQTSQGSENIIKIFAVFDDNKATPVSDFEIMPIIRRNGAELKFLTRGAR